MFIHFMYKLWHQQVKRIVEDYCTRGMVAVVHYLNPIGFKGPGQVRKNSCSLYMGACTNSTKSSTKAMESNKNRRSYCRY